MDSVTNLLIVSLILITGCIVIFMLSLVQILRIIKRILLKIELRIDNFELTQEEIKLKILNIFEEIINRIRSYRKGRKGLNKEKKNIPVG